MKLWLIAIWRTIPRAWVIVAMPFVIPIVALALWWAVGGYFIKPTPLRQAQYAAELQRLLPLAKQGQARAQYRAGVILRDGLAGERDVLRAAALLERAAKAGNADARVAYGKMLESGQGVRQDYGKAAQMYRLAAGFARHADAQYALGDLYFYGRGVETDYVQAVAWYRKAADQGHAGAEAVLGSIYEKGYGVDRDPVAAYVWYALAARQAARVRYYRPDIDPAKALKELEAKMTRLDLETARKHLKAMGVPVAKTGSR